MTPRAKTYISTTQAARILGISTVAVFKRIKSGALPARKIGRNYAIEPAVLGLKEGKVTLLKKKKIQKAVRRAVTEYGEALRKLGKE